MDHRENCNLDDGDEVTYVDRKTESNSSQIPFVDFNTSATRNKAVVIDDHMSFLLSDSLRGRKWKPDYVSKRFICLVGLLLYTIVYIFTYRQTEV